MRVSLENDSRPTFMPDGMPVTNLRAASSAAARRVGTTSVADIDPDVSMASRIVPRCLGTFETLTGRASPTTSAPSAHNITTAET